MLVLTPDFPPAHGGVQRLVERLVACWTRADACVVTPGDAGLDRFDWGRPYEVRRTSKRRRHRPTVAWLNLAALRQALLYRPDVTLSAHIVTSPAAAAIHRLVGAPFVQYLHGREVVNRSRLVRLALARSAAAIAVSRHTASLALSVKADARIQVVPPGVDPPTAPRQDRSQRPLVVTVARLEGAHKGHDVMVEAIASLRERIPDVLWAVIGDGALRSDLAEWVATHGLHDHVLLLGALDDAERDAWLERAWAFAMPSRVGPDGGGEGFGIAYLEAAAHGLPVVAGDEGGALDAVIDGRTGLLVTPTDPGAVAEALEKLLLDPELATKLGEAGASRAREFAWPRIAHRVERLLLAASRSG